MSRVANADRFQIASRRVAEIYQATITLTNAQIKGLPNAYIEAVPTPGASQYCRVHGWVLAIDASFGAYTNIDTAPNLSGFTVAYGDWDGDASTFSPNLIPATAALQIFLGGQLITLPTAANYPTSGYPTYGGTVASSNSVNKPLKLVGWNNAAGDYTGGHASNHGTLRVEYSVEDVP